MADRDDMQVAETAGPKRTSRRLRVAAIITATFLALIIATVLFAPALLSAGVGVGLIERLASNEGRRIDIGDLDLQWSGAQRIEGLKVRDAAGGYATNLNLDLNGSLWSWATGSRAFGVVSLTGEVVVDPTVKSDRPREPARVPAGLSARVEIDDLDVRVEASGADADSASIPHASASDLSGFVSLSADGEVEFDIAGGTSVEGAPGHLAATGALRDLIAPDGVITPQSARGELTARAEALPSAFADRLTGQEGRLAALLGDRVDLDIRFEGGAEAGAATLLATSPRAAADVQVEFRDNIVRLARPAEIRAMIDQRALDAWLPREFPIEIAALTGAGGVDGGGQRAWQLSISDFEAPLTAEDRGIGLASLRIDATLTGAPIAIRMAEEESAGAASPPVVLNGIVASLSSGRLADSITIDLAATPRTAADASAADEMFEQAARIESHVELRGLVDERGELAPANVIAHGTLRAVDTPTALVEALIGRDLDLPGIIGPRIDSVALSAAADADDDDVIHITLNAAAPTFDLSVAADWADGVITASSTGDSPNRLLIRAMNNAQREYLNALVAERGWPLRAQSFGELRMTLDRFQAPITGVEDVAASIAVDGSLVADAITISAGAVGEPVTIDGLDARLATDALGERVAIDVIAALLGAAGERAPMRLNAIVTAPLDASARAAQGSLALDGAPTTLVSGFAGNEYEAALREALGPAVTVSLSADVSAGTGAEAESSADAGAGRQSITLEATGQRARVSAAAQSVAGGDAYETRATVNLRLTPALIAALRPPNSNYALVEPASMRIRLAPTIIRRPETAGGDWTSSIKSAPLALKVISEPLRVAGIARGGEPLGVDDLELDLNWPRGIDGPMNVMSGATIIGPNAATAGVARVEVEYSRAPPATGEAAALATPAYGLAGSVEFSGINMHAVEAIVGVEPGNLAGWIGEAGSARIELAPRAAGGDESAARGDGAPSQLAPSPHTLRLAAEFDRLRARIDATVTDQSIEIVDQSEVSMTIARDLTNHLLTDRFVVDSLAVADDVDVDLEIIRATLPTALLQGEATTPDQFGVEAVATASTVRVLGGPEQPLLDVENLRLVVGGSDLAGGVGYNLTAALISEAAGEKPGSVDLTGLSRASSNDWSDLRHDFDGSIVGAPVEVVDRFANLGGRLSAALGATMDVKLDLADATLESGLMTARINSPNGWLNVRSAEIDRKVLRSTRPVRAMLDVTPLLAETLLQNVNPIFYDVRKQSGPLLFEAQTLALPLDGDLSKLEAKFMIDLGQVDVPSGGIIDDLLGTLGEAQPQVTPASIPPVKVRVDGGVLSYDELILQSERYNIRTGGSVDLIDRKLDLWAAVPLIGWRTVFGDLLNVDLPIMGEISPEIPFYLKITGPIDDPTIKADPQGAQRVADEFFQNTFGNVLETLFPKKNR